MSRDLPTLPVVRRKDGWWIVGSPALAVPDHGAYGTKAEALDDRQGLLRVFKRWPKLLDPEYGAEWRASNLVPTISVFRAAVPAEWRDWPREKLAALGVTGFRRKLGPKVLIVVRRKPQKVLIVVPPRPRKRLADRSMF